MSKKFKIAVIAGAFVYDVEKMFKSFGYEVVKSFDPNAEAVAWLGGADVDPGLYGESRLRCTSSFPRRDAQEISFFQLYKDLPKIGICRGGQLLNVLSGGKIWQDTDGHEGGQHMAYTPNGDGWKVSTIHHQMMRPSSDADVLLTADESSYVTSPEGDLYKSESPYKDIEAVYYKSTNSLCYQAHPEIGSHKEQTMFFELVHKYLGI